MASSNKMRVVLLASEWRTKRDELSTFNRELAIQLAKHRDVQVSVFLPRCDQDEESAALKHNITLIQATKRPGYDETHWLCFPPKNLQMDFVIGHGVELGRQAHVIRESHNCKWIQFVHTDPEEQGMFKDCSDAISEGAKKRQDEVDLCVSADFVVAVGSKVAEAYQSYLRFCKKDQNVFVLTPGIFSDFSDIPQCSQDGSKCRVLAFGHGNAEDFSLKGFDIAAKAVAKLNDAYLVFVGAKKQDEVTGRLKEYNIPRGQLRVRSFTEIREHLEKQFSEVDLAIMPSRTEGFGLTALEALSAGLPVLVNANSGFGEALGEVAFGSQYVIESEDAEVWAAEIKKVWTKSRKIRLQESKTVRYSYVTKYSWEEQCRDLVEKMRFIVNERSRSWTTILEVVEEHPDADILGAVNQPHLPQPAIEERNVSRTSEDDTMTLSRRNTNRSGKRKIQSESTSDQGADEEGPSSSKKESRSISGTIPKLDTLIRLVVGPSQDLSEEQQDIVNEMLARQLQVYMEYHSISTAELERLGGLIEHMESVYNVTRVAVNVGSLKIVLHCSSLESLERLWSDCLSGHLNEVAEGFLVTDEMKRKLKLETVRLKTTLEEENYLLCKQALMEMSGTAGSTDVRSQQTASNEGASTTRTNTSSDFQGDKEHDVSWMVRAEKAKASRSVLHKASIRGQYKTVKMLLDNGEDVDQRDQFSLTPLHLACWYGQESVVSLLLEYGANVNAVDRFQRTPLQKVERHNHQSIVQLLLANNASPSYQQPLSLKSLSRKAFLSVDKRSGYNLLQAAVFEGDYNVVWKAHAFLDNFVEEMNSETTSNNAKLFPRVTAVNILLSLDKKKPGHEDIDKLYQEDVESYNTVTELHRCVRNGDTEKAVELVLNGSVDINISAKSNLTPLLCASLSSSSTVIKTLIDLGADVNVQRTGSKEAPLSLAATWNNYMAICLLLQHGAFANIQDTGGHTPFLGAVGRGFFNVSKFLIKSGCDIDLRNNMRETPLIVAVKANDEKLVKLLLANNADANIQNIYRNTPLHESARRGFFEVSKLLIEARCDINHQNRDDSTPLYIAVKKDDEDHVKLLLQNDADVSIQDIKRNTPLHESVRQGSFKVSKLLIEAGCDINRQNRDDKTPLYVAVEKNDENHVKLLLENNADVSIQDIKRNTPLHESVRQRSLMVSKLLIEAGCNINHQNRDDKTPLCIAVEKNDETHVKLLVENNADVSIRDIKGNTPLHESIRQRSLKVSKFLIEAGCNISHQNRDDKTPLFIAVEKNDENHVKLLLENNAHVNIQEINGNTPLHESVRQRSLKVSKLLIEAGCNINHRNRDDKTPLFIAVEKNDENHVKLLLENNAHVSFQDTNGNTPLHESVRQGSWKVSKLLIEGGRNINHQNRDDKTPLYIAVEKNDENHVKLLLENNAHVNIQEINGNTPLHESVRQGSCKVSKLLIEAGCNINLSNIDRETPLYIAIKSNNENIVKLLLANNANANIEDSYRNAPLHESVRRGSLKVSKLLIEAGCNINHRNKDFRTPLYVAVNKNDENHVKLLLENNADVSIQEIKRNTPLHEAVRQGSLKVSQLLIESRCDVNHRNSNSETPLSIAAVNNRENCVKLLLENKADANIQDTEGNTALHESVRRGFSKVSQLLIESGCNSNLRNKHGRTPLDMAVAALKEGDDSKGNASRMRESVTTKKPQVPLKVKGDLTLVKFLLRHKFHGEETRITRSRKRRSASHKIRK